MSATKCELHGWDRNLSSFDFCPTCRYRERQARGEEDFEDITRMLQPSRVAELRKHGVAVVEVAVRPDGKVRIWDPSTSSCPFCGKMGPHRSGPGDRFHHVVTEKGELCPG